MTEKRFVKYYAGRIIKSLIGIEDVETGRVCITIEENILLLNELNDENSKLKIENKELQREVNLLTEFFRKNNFSLDDFNEWLTKEKWGWEAKEALSERFGD